MASPNTFIDALAAPEVFSGSISLGKRSRLTFSDGLNAVVDPLNGTTVVTAVASAADGNVNATKAAQFNGNDAVGVGTINAQALSGSLTRLANGQSFIVGLGGIAVTSASNGQVIVSGSTSGDVNATRAAQFNGNDAIGVGTVSATALTGSLTKLSSGVAYIVGQGGVTVTTGALGQVFVSSSLGGTNAVTIQGVTVKGAPPAFSALYNDGSVITGSSWGRPVFDIRNFGAVGGNNVDGAAIQAAIDAARAASSPTTSTIVHIPPSPLNTGWQIPQPLVVSPGNYEIRTGYYRPSIGANGTYPDLRSSGNWQGDMMVVGPNPFNERTPTIANDGTGFFELLFTGSGVDPQINLSEAYCAEINTLPSCTIELFIRPLPGNSGGPLLTSHGGRGQTSFTHDPATDTFANGFYFTMNPNGHPNASINTTNGFYPMTSSLAITSSIRTKVAVSYDGSFMRMYVSGCYAGKVPASGTIVRDYHSNLVLGGRPAAWEPIDLNLNATQCKVSSIAIRNSAKFTSEAGGIGAQQYAPETSQLTGSTDTLFLLNFNSSASIGTDSYPFLVAQTWTNVQRNPFYTNGALVYCRWRGMGLENQAQCSSLIGGLVIQGFDGNSGIDVTLSPNTYIRDNIVYAGNRAITFRNNTYLQQGDNNEVHVGPTGQSPGYTQVGMGGETWGVGKIGAAGVALFTRLQGTVIGGYSIVDTNASGGEYNLVYVRAGAFGGVGSPGHVYCGSILGQDLLTLRNPYFTDENGNLSADTAFFFYNCWNVEFDGGVIQAATLTTGSLVTFDGVGDAAFNSIFWGAGSGNKSNFRFIRGNTSAPIANPVKVLCTNQNTTLGPGCQWLGPDPTYHGAIEMVGLGNQTSYVKPISGARVGIRELDTLSFFSGSLIEVADPGSILTGSLYVNLPTAFPGYGREIYNSTSQTIIVGCSGSGGTPVSVPSLSSSLLRSKGTGWRKASFV